MNDLRAALRNACSVYNKLPDAAASTVDGSGVRSFCTRAANTVCICPRFSDGARTACVVLEDVCLLVTDASDSRSMHVHAQTQLDSKSGNIRIAYALEADAGSAPKVMRVCVHVCGVLLVDTRVVRRSFDGQTDGRLHTQHMFPRQGCRMAVHPTGTRMAVHPAGTCIAFSDHCTDCVNVFTLPDFQCIGKLGEKGAGPTGLDFPSGLCFTDVGTLLIADCGNNRVQHWTLDGVWLASYYPVGKPWCVDARGDAVAVGCDYGTGVRVFSSSTGLPSGEWLVGGCVSAVAFMDAGTLAIAYYSGESIDLYTLQGVLKTRLAYNIISFGLAVCADGCLLASDFRRNCVRVFLPTGDEWNASLFSTYSFEKRPCTIAVHAGHAYVLEYINDDAFRICVFE